jgi:quercetin dioxygenase-like cupin family protein
MKMHWLIPTLQSHNVRVKAALLIVAVVALQAVLSTSPSAGQVPPARPTQRFLSSFPVSAAPAQYELVEQVLDFRPGAATRLHAHGGPAFVTVLEGQVTRREGNVESVYGPGQTFIEAARVSHSVTNKGSVPARVFASFLLSPGQPQTVNDSSSPIPALPATVAYLGRTSLGTQPSEFTLTQAVVDFSPGAFQPRHHHGGPGLVMVIDGEVAFRTDQGEVRRKPGETFADIAGAHDALNVATGTSTTVVTFLIRKGEPQTTFLTTTATQPAGTIRPPATGDGGLASRP